MSYLRPVRSAGSNARVRFAAPGRWSWSLLVGGLLALLAGCTPVGDPGEPAPTPGPEDVSGPVVAAAERTAAVVTEARSLAEMGQDREALRRLLDVPAEAADDVVLDLVREISRRLAPDQLEAVLAEAPDGHPVAVPGRVIRAVGLLLSGNRDDARAMALSALEAGARGADAEHARAVAEGRLPPGIPALRLGALLPLSGSPAMRTFAAGISEGMEAALVAAGLDGVVEMEVLDTGGDVSTAGALVRAAQSGGVLGVVGPLQDDALAAASAARTGQDLVLLSPTAYSVPGGSGVYSLGATDPGAALTLARWAARAGLTEVAVLHASRGTSAEEARLFTEAFQAEGGRVVRSLVYDPGATYFQEQLRAVHALRPQALFLPAPPEDVQALAPQVTFFGLDTLAIQVLGTSGWTDRATLAGVSRRHLDGVVAATPRRPTRSSEGFRRFVEAYETRFRRSLVDPAIPALGYDAASLLLEAVRAGARTPEAVRRSLQDVQGFQGATGVLSVRAGQIVREHQVVCLWAGEMEALAPGQRPEPAYRPYPPNPETGEVPEGPGRPSGFRCPGVGPPPPPG